MSSKSIQVSVDALYHCTPSTMDVGKIFKHESKTKKYNGTFIVVAQIPVSSGPMSTCYCRRIGKQGKPVGPIVEMGPWQVRRGFDGTFSAAEIQQRIEKNLASEDQNEG